MTDRAADRFPQGSSPPDAEATDLADRSPEGNRPTDAEAPQVEVTDADDRDAAEPDRYPAEGGEIDAPEDDAADDRARPTAEAARPRRRWLQVVLVVVFVLVAAIVGVAIGRPGMLGVVRFPAELHNGTVAARTEGTTQPMWWAAPIYESHTAHYVAKAKAQQDNPAWTVVATISQPDTVDNALAAYDMLNLRPAQATGPGKCRVGLNAQVSVCARAYGLTVIMIMSSGDALQPAELFQIAEELYRAQG